MNSTQYQQTPVSVAFNNNDVILDSSTIYFQQPQQCLIQHEQQIELERLRQVQQQAAFQQQRALLHQQMMYYEQELQQQQQVQVPQQLQYDDGGFDYMSATTANQQGYDYPLGAADSPLSTGGKAQRRAEHNAIERARRESLNTKFQQLAHSLPNLQNDRRPSKGTIIERTLEYVKQTVQKEERFQNEIEQLRQANESLISKMTTDIIYEDDEQADLDTPIGVTDEYDEEEEEEEEGHFSSLSSITSSPSSPNQQQQQFYGQDLMFNKLSTQNSSAIVLNNKESFIHF